MSEGFHDTPKKRRSIEGSGEKPNVPEIYALIEQSAPMEAVLEQVRQDFEAGEQERVYLGIEEMILRGKEGMPALSALSNDASILGPVARNILEFGYVPIELMQMLGIRRSDSVSYTTDPDGFGDLHAYAQEKGYTHKTLEECWKEYREPSLPHRDETLDSYIISRSATFGMYEPTYLELLGPREILRMRREKEPRLLLLGSLGRYSAEEFDAYAKKLNSKSISHVIDPWDFSIQAIARAKQPGQALVQGDARQMPFADSSFDHIYTNLLFHFLRSDDMPVERFERDIAKILSESNRVLKPGGSLVLLERSYGLMQEEPDRERLLFEHLNDLFERSGLEAVQSLPTEISFGIVPERGTAVIDENGFPHYEHTMLNIHEGHPAAFRLRKPE